MIFLKKRAAAATVEPGAIGAGSPSYPCWQGEAFALEIAEKEGNGGVQAGQRYNKEPKEAPKEEMEDRTGEVGYGTQMLGFGCSASPVENQGSDPPHQSGIGLGFPTFSPPPFLVSLESCNTSAEKEGLQRSDLDPDCLICSEQYSHCRPPKVLACQHVFCPTCLKLLLQNQEGTWRIVCPVCRKATVVFGGLICSLSTKEGPRQGALANRGPKGERLCSPDSRQATEGAFSIHQEDGGHRGAAKRLLCLLLLLVLLGFLAFPFIYHGSLKWAISVAIVWGLAVVGVLCWNPNWQYRCLDVSIPAWRKTASRSTPMS